jgi:hypothetical protein
MFAVEEVAAKRRKGEQDKRRGELGSRKCHQ